MKRKEELTKARWEANSWWKAVKHQVYIEQQKKRRGLGAVR